MHSLIAMNEDNQRLTENITWADNRANDYADLIEKSYAVLNCINELVHRFILCAII